MYGEPDLVPNIEGYLILAYLKTGQHQKALQLNPVFLEKCNAKTWNDFERVAELRAEVANALLQHKSNNNSQTD